MPVSNCECETTLVLVFLNLEELHMKIFKPLSFILCGAVFFSPLCWAQTTTTPTLTYKARYSCSVYFTTNGVRSPKQRAEGDVGFLLTQFSPPFSPYLNRFRAYLTAPITLPSVDGQGQGLLFVELLGDARLLNERTFAVCGDNFGIGSGAGSQYRVVY